MGPSEEELRAIEERKREKQEEREEYRRQMQKISLERAHLNSIQTQQSLDAVFT